MNQAALTQWQNFYVIVGSSAGALTGLQFVTIVLIAQARLASSMLEIRAFGTPTVVHFCAALLISGILSAPWHTLSSAAFAVGACGGAGVIYILTVMRHARRQTGYSPDARDWLWYVATPLVSYAGLLGAAILLTWHPTSSLFAIAAITLLLLFIGIRNSWDTVTFRYDVPETELQFIEPGSQLPGGLVALYDGRGRNETPLWLPEQRTLVFADALTAPAGELRVWASPFHKERALPALRAVLDLPFERVIVSHGEPVHTRAAYERALDAPTWTG